MADRIGILLRHGDYHQLPDTPSAHQPFPLNESGEAQARHAIGLVATMVRRNGWALMPALHCSTLLRAWQTATILADGLSGCREIIQSDALAERGLGNAANLSLSQLAEIIRRDPRCDRLPEGWKRDSHFRLPLVGAESLMSAGNRVADYIANTMESAAGSDDSSPAIVFIGHGGAFRHAAFHLGVLSMDQVSRLSMHHARPVAIARGEDGRWRHAAGHWKVRRDTNRDLD